MNCDKIVICENITMKYQSQNGETEAIENISFSVSPGEHVSIIGPSGCGKSTLLSIISGLIKPTSGDVIIAGKSITKERAHIGYMPQKDSLLPFRTIRENVMLGLEVLKQRNAENEAYADKLLETYGLTQFRDKYPKQLSGGMRQRCALIRTLAIKPDILLLDEAFSALDYQTRLAVCDDIYSIIKKEDKTAIIVTHDISESISLSDRVIVLSKRPSTIKTIHNIEFAEGRKSPLACREQPEFRGYFNAIWRDIDVHV